MYMRLVVIILSLCLVGCKEDKPCVYMVDKTPVTTASLSSPEKKLNDKLVEQAEKFLKPRWEAPKHWEPQALGALRKGSWMIDNDRGKCDVSVTVFPGDVGGLLANVKRWAEQIGLSDIKEEELSVLLEPMMVDGRKAHCIVLDNPVSSQAIVACILFFEEASWFFKVMGDRECVLGEKNNFKHFLQTVSMQNNDS